MSIRLGWFLKVEEIVVCYLLVGFAGSSMKISDEVILLDSLEQSFIREAMGRSVIFIRFSGRTWLAGCHSGSRLKFFE